MGNIIIMNELGSFELGVHKFQEKVEEVLQSHRPVIGVIKYERNPFNKQLAGCNIIFVKLVVK